MHPVISRPRRAGRLALCVALAAVGCARKRAADGGTTQTTNVPAATGGGGAQPATTTTTTVPQVGAISLSTLGTGSAGTGTAGLASAAPCAQATLGVMGLALSGACATAPLAARLLLGSDDGDFNGDGVMTCADLAAAKARGLDAGLLLHLLCENVILNNDGVTSLAFGAPPSISAISFAAWKGDTTHAAGTWTQGNSASYPADVRLWSGAAYSALTGRVAVALSDVNNGSVQLPDLLGGTGGAAYAAALSFSNKATTASCAAAPSNASCHWQDIRIYGGEGDTLFGPPNGLHLKVYADDKKAPKFLAVEGMYRYTAASAAHFAPTGLEPCPLAALPGMRTAYFQVVQRGGQIWGRFAMRDKTGALLTCPGAGGVDAFAVLAADAGVCQNLGSASWVPCTDVVESQVTSLWTGEGTFVNVTSSPVAAIFDGAPAAAGLCTASGGCRAFTAADGDAPQ